MGGGLAGVVALLRWGSVLAAEPEAHAHPTWSDFTPTTWVAVVLIAIGAFWSIWKAVMYTIHPGETEPDHIKRIILQEPEALQVTLSSKAAAGASDARLADPSLEGPGDRTDA